MTFEDFCSCNNIIVKFENFTTKVKGFCLKEDEYYIVFVNSRFCSSSCINTIQHEIIHIMENHFQCDRNHIEECEKEVKILINDMKLNFHYSMDASH